MIVNLWRYRAYIVKNALSDVRYRYAGSAMGIAWNVITLLAQILIYSFVFSQIMVMRQILRTVHRHFGRVPSQWVYGYAHAVLHAGRPDTRGADVIFAFRLIGLSLATFVRYRSPVPRSEWRLWALWIRHALRGR